MGVVRCDCMWVWLGESVWAWSGETVCGRGQVRLCVGMVK